MDSSDWQPKLATHTERCKYAFDNSLFCDVEFSVVDSNGNKATIAANKYPLAVCSPVFEAMFYGTLAETKSPIHIPDCTKEGLQEVLRYAHYEEAKLTGSNVMEVLYLAEKYMMPSLEEKCQHYVRNEVEPDYLLSFLPQVQNMGKKNLEKVIWEIIDVNAEQVILSKSFLDISRELLRELLKRDTLKVNELNLFKAVDKWVTKRIEGDVCNGETKRAILGDDIIRLIRFPLMTQKEIAEIVLPCQILVPEEVTELFSIFAGVQITTGIFSLKKRPFPSEQLLVSDTRFGKASMKLSSFQADNRCYDGNEEDALNFTVNEVVNLVGVRLFGSQGKRYTVKLKINKTYPYECISETSSSYDTEKEKVDGLYYGFSIYLEKPVRLDPNTTYNIQAIIGGPKSWSGRTVVSAGDQIAITFEDASNSSNATTSNVGQFPSLILQTV